MVRRIPFDFDAAIQRRRADCTEPSGAGVSGLGGSSERTFPAAFPPGIPLVSSIYTGPGAGGGFSSRSLNLGVAAFGLLSRSVEVHHLALHHQPESLLQLAEEPGGRGLDRRRGGTGLPGGPARRGTGRRPAGARRPDPAGARMDPELPGRNRTAGFYAALRRGSSAGCDYENVGIDECKRC